MKSAASKALLGSGIAAVLAVSGGVVSSAVLVREISSAPAVTVDSKAFSWAGKLNYRVAAASSTKATFRAEIARIEVPGLPDSVSLPSRRLARARGVNSKEFSATLAKLKDGFDKLHRDEIQIHQAAQERVRPSDFEAVQRVHRALQSGFTTALLSSNRVVAAFSEPAMNSQIQPVAPSAPLRVKREPLTTQASPEKPLRLVTPRPVPNKVLLTQSIQPAAPRLPQELSVIDGREVKEAVAAAETRVGEAIALSATLNTTWESWRSGVQVASARLVPQSVGPAPQSITDVPLPQQVPRIAQPEISSPIFAVGSIGPSRSADSGYSGPAVSSAGSIGKAAAPAAPVDSQPAQSPTQKVSSHPVQAASRTPIEDSGWITAFDWSKQIQPGKRTHLAGHWETAFVEGFWPTILATPSASVPLVSGSAATMLAWAAASRLQMEMGIVFGRVPDGWSIEFSGRSERPIYLTRENKPQAPSETEGARYFALVNAAPGAHLLYLSSAREGASGAIAVPVQAGKATYLDLTGIQVTEVAGRVIDAGSELARALADVRVRALGNEKHQGVVSRSSGEFKLSAVAFHPQHPVIFETESKHGYDHRHQIAPASLESLVLFRIGESQVRSWVGQLEGGVSPESGLVVAAISPHLVTSVDGPVFPKIRPLGAAETLAPETYSVSPKGQLQVRKALDPSLPRFIGVQVPEGAVVAELREGVTDQLVWSDVVIASPRVINLIGP